MEFNAFHSMLDEGNALFAELLQMALFAEIAQKTEFYNESALIK